MRSRAAIRFSLLAAALAFGTTAEAQQDGSPTLVVAMAVDQLRGDLLDHYAEAFSGGLAAYRGRGLPLPASVPRNMLARAPRPDMRRS